MEWLVRSAVREDAVLRVAADLERDDARHVRLQRQHLQVEQQFHVLGEGVGHAGRRVGQRPRFAAPVVHFDRLDATFDLAHVVHVLVDSLTIAGAELTPDALDLTADPVEDAAARVTPRGALFGRVA